jgi:hypothetical protein
LLIRGPRFKPSTTREHVAEDRAFIRLNEEDRANMSPCDVLPYCGAGNQRRQNTVPFDHERFICYPMMLDDDFEGWKQDFTDGDQTIP